MTTPENNIQDENEVIESEIEEQELPPVIPPIIFLLVALAGLIVTITVAFTASEFNIIGWGALAVTVLSLILWAFMFPEEVVNLIKGRTLTYGVFGIVVTAVVIFASVLVYNVVQEQGLSQDYSERDVFSLDAEVQDVLIAMGDDPSIPTVQILGFYSATSGAQRDRISVLLQDMLNNSGGKIAGYEFVDPALEPLRTENYLGENARMPSIVIGEIDPATGAPSLTDYEIAAPEATGQVAAGQFQIINAMLSLSVEGDFRAYFLNVDGSLDTLSASDEGASGIVDDIEDEWTVDTIDPLLLSNPPVTLNDPTASAEVMIIAGGTQALSADEIAVIATYIQDGGDLIVLGGINTDGGVSTALADNFASLLWDNFGVRLRDDLVIDPAIPVRQLGRVYQVNNYGTHPIVDGLNPATNNLVMSSPRSIEIAENPPTTVSVLVSTSDQGYAKTGLDLTVDLTEADLAQAEGDLEGAIPLAVAAENVETGARLVLFGSTDLMENQWRVYANIEAPEVAESTIYWASDAQNFSDVVRQLVPEAPELDEPIFLQQTQLSWMGFVVTGVIPFGMLLLGLLVWWVRRPSAIA